MHFIQVIQKRERKNNVTNTKPLKLFSLRYKNKINKERKNPLKNIFNQKLKRKIFAESAGALLLLILLFIFLNLTN